jgi:hypothetical protein
MLPTIVIVNAAVAVFPEVSLAIQVTVVVPIANVLPEEGVHTRLDTATLSDAVTVYVTTADVVVVDTVIADGTDIVGAVVSVVLVPDVPVPIVKLTIDEAGEVLPALSVALAVMLWLPAANAIAAE